MSVEAPHLRALAIANEVKGARTALKRRVAAGELTVADVIDEPCVANAKLVAVICWQRRWGRVKARRPLRVLGASELLVCAELSDRQREMVKEMFG